MCARICAPKLRLWYFIPAQVLAVILVIPAIVFGTFLYVYSLEISFYTFSFLRPFQVSLSAVSFALHLAFSVS